MADLSIIFDGDIKRIEESTVPVTSRGLMYGDGCFETFRSYSGHFLKLDDHLNRFRRGLQFLGIGYPQNLKRQPLTSNLESLLKNNNLTDRDAVIRLQVWREGKRGYKVKTNSNSHYSIVASPLSKPKASYKLSTVDIKRIPAKSIPAKYKLTNGINYILAARQARAKHADDALMETINHHISETTIANIFWVNDGIVYTPSANCDILPGITREIVIHLLRHKMNIAVKEGTYQIEAIKKAKMVFLCNSVKEIAPVNKIDDQSFQVTNAFLQNLCTAFEEFRNEQIKCK